MPAELFQSIEVETLSWCNMRCATCPVAAHPRARVEMSEATFRRVVDELARAGYAGAFSPHFYNEPFADPRLPELMDYAVRALSRATFHVFTNTTLLDAATFRRMPKAIASYVVTIDSPPIRTAYERLMAELAPAERAKFSPRSIQADKLYNRAGAAPASPDMRKVGRCEVPALYCCVAANGDVPLCYNDYFGENVLGNVNETPLLTIWQSERARKLRADIAAGRHQGLICERCQANFDLSELGRAEAKDAQTMQTGQAGASL